MILGFLTRQLKRKLLLEAVLLGVGAYKAIRDRDEDEPASKRARRKARSTRGNRSGKRRRDA